MKELTCLSLWNLEVQYRVDKLPWLSLAIKFNQKFYNFCFRKTYFDVNFSSKPDVFSGVFPPSCVYISYYNSTFALYANRKR
jgi:hypothetical protein